jgi:hypothetical protein
LPTQLKTLALDSESAAQLLDVYPVLGEQLSVDNYVEKFKALIHLVSSALNH